jgi:hypothetical protein
MKEKTYNTHYGKLSNLILSMSEDQQAKLLDLATRMQSGENPFANNGRNNPSLCFTSGVLAGWGLVTIFLIIL